MKKFPNSLIIILVIVVVVASKFIFFSKDEVTKDARKGKPKLSVNYYVVKARPYMEKVFSAGKTGAFNEVNLMPELAGKVTALYLKEGQLVNKGDLLVKINDADFQAQLLKIHTQLQLANQKLERLNKLKEINGVSEEEVDLQENEIAVLKADEKFYQAQIAKTTIVAPFTGIVGLKNVSEGAFVTTNTSLVSLVQLNPLFVEFSVPGKYSGNLKKNMVVQFEAEQNLGVETYSAQIYAIEPKMDEATKTIRVRAEYNGAKSLYPGTYVQVYIGFGDFGNKLMVPSQCVVPVLKGQKVFRYVGGKAVETPIKIGPRSDKQVLVLEGLSEGDTVITTGLMSIKKDIEINLIPSAD